MFRQRLTQTVEKRNEEKAEVLREARLRENQREEGERTASRKALPHRFATAAGEGARVRMLERTKKTVV